MTLQAAPITRAAHLIPFLGFLREVGAPVERYLREARLPVTIHDQPDQYVSVPAALKLVTASQRREGIDDFVVRANLRMNLAQLSDDVLARCGHAPTLHAALETFFSLVTIEDSLLNYWIEQKAGTARIVNNLYGLFCHQEGYQFSEWVQNLVVVTIVRAFAGTSWCPEEMAFQSTSRPGRFAYEQYPNTRFLLGQRATWIDVPRIMLSLPPPPGLHAKSAQAERRLEQRDSAEPLDLDLATSMKLLLRPYLGNSTPSIELSAEIIGMSVRTLQRRLGATGLTHSGLLEQLRFETAAQMLKNTEQNVIHVAYEVGYEDPSNFARAFRRIAGVSPREYRQQFTPSP